eukprot:5904545-Amphidinium_carterae.1
MNKERKTASMIREERSNIRDKAQGQVVPIAELLVAIVRPIGKPAALSVSNAGSQSALSWKKPETNEWRSALLSCAFDAGGARAMLAYF